MRPTKLDELLFNLETRPSEDLDRRIAAMITRAARQGPGSASPELALWRRIMKSKYTKIAAALVLITSVLILTQHLSGKPPIVRRPGESIIANQAEAHKHVQLEKEIEQAKAYFENKDLPGLIGLLETGIGASQVIVSDFLAQIGDVSALPMLHRLADKWQGASDANPFQKAIDQINAQGKENPSPPVEDVNQQAMISEPAVKKVTSDSTVKEGAESVIKCEGAVLNEQGEPLKNVYVWAQWMNASYECSAFDHSAHTTSAGRFKLMIAGIVHWTDSALILYFEHPDYGLGWQWVTNNTESDMQSIEVVLCRPASIKGQVMDKAGDPVSGATVEASVQLQAQQQGMDLLLWSLNQMAVTTGSDGYFIIDRLPESARAHLRVSALNYGLYSTRTQSLDAVYPIKAGDHDVQVILKHGGIIKGKIVYEDGRAYTQKATVIVADSAVQGHEDICHSDESGYFETIGLPPGKHLVRVLAKADKHLCLPKEVDVKAGSEGTDLVFVIRKGQVVPIRVLDQQTGRPLNNIWVFASVAGSDPVDEGRTDAQGDCVLKIPADEYVITAEGWRNGQRHMFEQPVTVAPGFNGSPIEILITSRAMIPGQLIDIEGNPVAGMVKMGMDEWHKTDSQGRFHVPEPWGSSPREHHLVFGYNQEKTMGRVLKWCQSDSLHPLIIVMESVSMISGCMVDSKGLPEPDAKPKLGVIMEQGSSRYSSKPPWKLTYGRDGVFVAENVPVGLPLCLSAQRRGFQMHHEVHTLLPGEILDVGDLILKSIRGITEDTDWSGVIKGRVIDEKGKSVRGYKVDTNIGTHSFKDTTNFRGRFKLSGVPIGKKLSVGLYVPGYGHCYERVYADGNDVTIQIFPQGWDLLNKQAPPLSIDRWLNHDPVLLHELQGQVVLLQVGVLLPNYGRDLTQAQDLYKQYASKGLRIIAVHQPLGVDWAGKVTLSDIEQFLINDEVPFIFCSDKGPSNGETYQRYDVKATPALYLIDKQGILRISPTREKLNEWIEKLLQE
jgi:protocatechuate 3,4-dioxygenase beta subunit